MASSTPIVAAATVSMEDFAKRVGFTLEDLALNRVGKVAPHQLSESYTQAAGLAGVVLIMLGFVLVLSFFGKVGVRGIILVVVFSALGVVFAVLSWKTIAGAWKRNVASAEGNLVLTHSPGSARQIVVVGSYNWHIDPGRPVPAVLVPGARYRVYYLPGSDMFLSIEPVADAPALDQGKSQ
jgi:hypothetical protein